MARSITRLASAAVVTGIATLALAGPASAVNPIDPDFGARVQPTPAGPTAGADNGWELAQIATGALGGVVLAGAGVAAAAGLRRRNQHLAHPV